MMRCAEMKKYIKSYCRVRKIEKRKFLNNHYDDTLEQLMEIMDALVQDVEKKQALNGHEKVKYLVFHRLLSSGYTGSHEISMAMSSDALYLDEKMSCVYWKPEIFYCGLENDMKQVRQILSKKYLRIEEYELLRIEQCLLSYDWELLCEFLSWEAARLIERMKASSLELEDEIQVLCGCYMDRLNVVYQEK